MLSKFKLKSSNELESIVESSYVIDSEMKQLCLENKNQTRVSSESLGSNDKGFFRDLFYRIFNKLFIIRKQQINPRGNLHFKKLTLISLIFVGSIVLAACSSNASVSGSQHASHQPNNATSSNNTTTSVSNQGASSQSAVLLADQNTIGYKTVTITYSGNISTTSTLGPSGVAVNSNLSGTGNLDFKTGYFSVDLDMASTTSTGTSTNFVTKVILANHQMYLSSPAFSTLTGGSSSQWYSINTLVSSGFLNSNTVGDEIQNPALFLQAIESVGKVQLTGNATINGVSYTQYQVSINLADAIEKAGSASASQISSCLNPSYNLPMTVLVNSNHTIHSISLSMNIANLFKANTSVGSSLAKVNSTYDLTLTFGNYGQSFSETVPSSSVPFPTNVGGGSSSSGTCS